MRILSQVSFFQIDFRLILGQPDLISETFVIFVVATTGAGAEPRSMTSLWNMLRRSDLPNDLFEDLQFAVFALGDTAYEKFCWPGKLLSRRMRSLGATEVLERGEGDEQHQLGYALIWLNFRIFADL